jgi:hypothetical protein
MDKSADGRTGQRSFEKITSPRVYRYDVFLSMELHGYLPVQTALGNEKKWLCWVENMMEYSILWFKNQMYALL